MSPHRRSSLSVVASPSTTLYELAYGYDTAGRLKTVERPVGPASTVQNLFTYAYKSGTDLVETLESKTGGAVTMTTTKTYDGHDRLATTRTTRGGPTGPVLSSHGYRHDTLGRRTRATTEDETYWSWDYNSRGEVTSGKKHLPDGTPMKGFQFGYDFDGIGNRNSATVNGRTSTYSKTYLNQYSSRTVPGTIDVVGTADPGAAVEVNSTALPSTDRQGAHWHHELAVTNTSAPQYPEIEVTGEIAGATPTTPAETRTGHVYLPKTPEEFTYDDDGNLTKDGRWTYTWDGENRLAAMASRTDTITVPLAARRALTFKYDSQSRRVEKVVTYQNVDPAVPVTTRFVWDGWNLLVERGGPGNLVRSYVWGKDLSGELEGAGGVGGLLAVHAHSIAKDFYPCYDGNGNVQVLVNTATGAVEAEYEYGPFGELVATTEPKVYNAVTQVWEGVNPFRVSTKYQDETGYAYYGNRYYDASSGRWLNRDPLFEQDEVNLYSFCANSPTTYLDYLGLHKFNWERGDVLNPIIYDPDTGKFNSKKPRTEAHFKSYSRALRLVAGGFFASREASRALSHYLKATGTPLPFSGAQMLRDDDQARRQIGAALYNGIRWVIKENVIGNFSGQPLPPEIGAGGQPEGPFGAQGGTDWGRAVGGFFARAYGSSTRNNDGSVCIELFVQMGDRYNFHHNSWGFGGVTDSEMATLHEVGLAQAYERDGGQVRVNIRDAQRAELIDVIKQLMLAK